MQLYIGGFAQGKLDLVLRETGLSISDVAEGSNLTGIEELIGKKILNHYHLLIKKQMEQEKEPEEFLQEIMSRFPDLILICDEVGNGIVPLDAFEREYREKTGRLLCETAERAEKVVRVFCGIGQRIK